MEQAHCSSATVSSAKPAERARDTKLKKMGIPVIVEDPKAGKKQQLLYAFRGTPPPDNADLVLLAV
jgi:hypothetical protein